MRNNTYVELTVLVSILKYLSVNQFTAHSALFEFVLVTCVSLRPGGIRSTNKPELSSPTTAHSPPSPINGCNARPATATELAHSDQKLPSTTAAPVSPAESLGVTATSPSYLSPTATFDRAQVQRMRKDYNRHSTSENISAASHGNDGEGDVPPSIRLRDGKNVHRSQTATASSVLTPKHDVDVHDANHGIDFHRRSDLAENANHIISPPSARHRITSRDQPKSMIPLSPDEGMSISCNQGTVQDNDGDEDEVVKIRRKIRETYRSIQERQAVDPRRSASGRAAVTDNQTTIHSSGRGVPHDRDSLGLDNRQSDPFGAGDCGMQVDGVGVVDDILRGPDPSGAVDTRVEEGSSQEGKSTASDRSVVDSAGGVPLLVTSECAAAGGGGHAS